MVSTVVSAGSGLVLSRNALQPGVDNQHANNQPIGATYRPEAKARESGQHEDHTGTQPAANAFSPPNAGSLLNQKSELMPVS